MKCNHSKTVVTTRCFTGGVTGADPNPMAHGGITDHELCLGCGATRVAHVNQCHVEQGAWTETEDEDE